MAEKQLRITCNYIGKKYNLFHIRYKEKNTIALDPLFKTRGDQENQLLNLKSYHWTLHNKRNSEKTTFYASTKGTFKDGIFSFDGKKDKIKIDERFSDIPSVFHPKTYKWAFENFVGRFPLLQCITLSPKDCFYEDDGIEEICFELESIENLNMRIFLSDEENIPRLIKEISSFKFNQTKLVKDFYPYLVLQLYSNH